MAEKESREESPEITETDEEPVKIKIKPVSETSEDQQSPEAEGKEGKSQSMDERLESAEKEAKENYDRFLRLSAEFDNYKKRSAREMESFRKYANESLLKDLLPVVDNLERAIQSSENNEAACIVEGVDLTLKDILKILEKWNVNPVESMGKLFDPNFHEAMMQEETDEYPENSVVKELQKGYTIHDRLLRPALVVVSKPRTVKR